MTANSPKLVAPPAHFREQLRLPGGIAREWAIAGAVEASEALKDKFTAILVEEVESLDEKARPDATAISRESAAELAKSAAVIFNLAGTYRYYDLQTVVASLLDTLAVMRERNLDCPEPLVVHVRAAKLLSPRGAALSHRDAALLIDQLKGVVRHLKAPEPCAPASCQACPARAN